MRITVTDCRKAGHCATGIKKWFEDHGFDFRAFLRDGIDAHEFIATGDAYAFRVVEMKMQREQRHGK